MSGKFTFFNQVLTSRSYSPFIVIQAMAIINGSLYVFGGTTGYIYSTDLHKLDLNTREWTQLKPNNLSCDLPEERWGSRIQAYLFFHVNIWPLSDYWQYEENPLAPVRVTNWLLDVRSQVSSKERSIVKKSSSGEEIVFPSKLQNFFHVISSYI